MKKTVKILDAIQRGKERVAFDVLYKSCWPKILSYIQKNAGSKAEAEDIFHDSLIVFLKQVKLGKFDKEKDVDGYVYVIAKNQWINHVKKRSKQIVLDDHNPMSEENIHEAFISKEWEDQVMKVMSALGERCKELLSLTIFHHFKLSEVMEKMGFGSIDVVKTKHYKCKQRLIKVVKDSSNLEEYLRNA